MNIYEQKARALTFCLFLTPSKQINLCPLSSDWHYGNTVSMRCRAAI